MPFSKSVYSFVTTERVFVILSTIVNTFFLLYFLGFLKNKNQTVESITFYLKIFISLFLISKFNPYYSIHFQNNQFTKFDREVAFAAGCYLLTVNGIEFYNKTYSIIKQVEETKIIEKTITQPATEEIHV